MKVSMTRKEAIAQLELLLEYCESMMTSEDPVWRRDCEALQMLISALRPISRDQVEKVWRGEWIIQQGEHKEYIKRCSKCGFPISGWWGADKFCANCGAPMTDQAVDMVMERLEALYD